MLKGGERTDQIMAVLSYRERKIEEGVQWGKSPRGPWAVHSHIYITFEQDASIVPLLLKDICHTSSV